MNTAVAAKLNKKERAQLQQAFTNDWRRPIHAPEIWRLVAVLLSVILLLGLLAVGLTAVGLTNVLPDGIPAEVLKSMIFLLLLIHFAAGQRQNALVRKLHDIAAAALEGETKRDGEPPAENKGGDGPLVHGL